MSIVHPIQYPPICGFGSGLAYKVAAETQHLDSFHPTMTDDGMEFTGQWKYFAAYDLRITLSAATTCRQVNN